MAYTLPLGPPLVRVRAYTLYVATAALALLNPSIVPIPPKALSTKIEVSTGMPSEACESEIPCMIDLCRSLYVVEVEIDIVGFILIDPFMTLPTSLI